MVMEKGWKKVEEDEDKEDAVGRGETRDRSSLGLVCGARRGLEWGEG